MKIIGAGYGPLVKDYINKNWIMGKMSLILFFTSQLFPSFTSVSIFIDSPT